MKDKDKCKYTVALCFHPFAFSNMQIIHNDILTLPSFREKEEKVSPHSLYVYIWKHHFNRSELIALAQRIAPWMIVDDDRTMCDKRLIERLSIRLLCTKLFDVQHDVIAYHTTGRPFLKDFPYEISISHSNDNYAISIAPFRHGIDIEGWGNKAERVSRMFVNEEERQTIDTLSLQHLQEKMTLLWSAKEAVYKYKDVEGLSFKDDIRLLPSNGDNELIAALPKSNDKAFVCYKTMSDIVLTCCGATHFAIK